MPAGKREAYRLKIDNPCHQDWNSMTEIEQGKYCSSCCKTVTDFTGFSNDEIIQMIRHSDEKLCGRLTDAQLSRTYELTAAQSSTTFRYKILAGLMAFFAANIFAAHGQTIKHPAPTQVISNQAGRSKIDNKKVDSSKPVKKTIKGKILDTSRTGIYGAYIRIKGANAGTSSDPEGNYALTISDSIKSDYVIVEVHEIGYETVSFPVSISELPATHDIVMPPREEVYITGLIIKGDIRHDIIARPAPIWKRAGWFVREQIRRLPF